MKRTEETLRSMIRAELQNISEALRDEMAQKIMEEVCKKALVEARFTDVKVEKLQEGVTKSTALWAMHEEMLPQTQTCLLYTSPSPRDGLLSRMPSSA